MSSKYSKKRKQEDDDTSEVGRNRAERSGSMSPPRSKKQPKEKEDDSEPAESMSIEETNKLRISLGLAPLEMEESKVREADDGTNEKIYNEDGFEFRHRKADNWADKKKESDIREKIEVSKAKRDIYSKVLKSKKLADSDEDDGGAASFVEKLRQKEIEAKQAAERAKMFDQLDDDFGVTATIKKIKKQKPKRKDEPSDTAGLVVGHQREDFLEGDQILVLQDKGVLDDGDEVLINPNMRDDERHKRNVELKKRKDTRRGFDEEVDEFGNIKNFGVLAKYDETLEGVEKKQFRLDEHGGVDIAEEKRELDAYRKLKMAGKRMETLEMPKYKLASEFYTHEEMAFRKVKKGGKKEKNSRKRKVLKASDLVPVEEAGEERKGDFGRRRRHGSEEMEQEQEEVVVKQEEDGEIKDEEDEAPKWKKVEKKADSRLEKLRQKTAMYDEEDSDEDVFTGGVDLTGMVLEDDAEDELQSILARNRKTQEKLGDKSTDVGKRVQEMLNQHEVKMEVDDDQKDSGVVVIDSTMEYCRHIGEITTLGIGGNRGDEVDVSELKKVKEEKDEADGFEKWKRAKIDKELKEKERRKREEKGGWLAAGKPVAKVEIDSDDEMALEEAKQHKHEDSDDEEEQQDDDYEPALGNEIDVSKGVGGMLKLAAQKGYLSGNNKKVNGPSLDHLKNKSTTEVDASRFDIEDKYMKKLDRLGTTNRGPIQAFNEKLDYKPEVNITYVDSKGRPMGQKDSYRELSYKFHGRNPGKKQLEKRANRKDKEERMLKTNSYDTPLGTLQKQRKKQKQLATPYLVLSGSNDHSSLKKE